MVHVVNLTPRVIFLQREDGTRETFPTSGKQARVEMKSIPEGALLGAPVVRQTAGPVSGLPAPESDVIYLVSDEVAQQVPTRRDVVAPDTGPTAIRDGDGKIVAVTRWAQYS